jgi:hypothetical protein
MNDRNADGGRIGECKNLAAYRTVHLGDAEGSTAIDQLKSFLGMYPAADDALVFRPKRGGSFLLA